MKEKPPPMQEDPSLLTIKIFLDESEGLGCIYIIIHKEKTNVNLVVDNMKPFLGEFNDLMLEKLPRGLLPLHNISMYLTSYLMLAC